MDFGAIFWITLIILVLTGLKIGHWKLFEKAGHPGWAALVPVYNWVIWLKIIGKPTWWAALLLIPVVGVLVWVAMTIDLVRAFGKYKLQEHAASLFIFPYFLPKIGFDPKVKYLGPPDTHKDVPAKGQIREWGDAILFAGVSALIIRTLFIEAFMIPTSSMERTLMAGDFLFVSKFHYGARTPMVPLSVPFIHNKINLGGVPIPSYVGAVQLPYWRIPGFRNVKRNDIVVFNYPAHDIDDLNDGAGLVKPTSMKENYIKRCVAVAGDTLQVIDQQVHINGVPGYNPPNMQYEYQVATNGTGFSNKRLNDLGFREFRRPTYENPNPNLNPNYAPTSQRGIYTFFMPDSIARLIRGFENVKKVDTMYRKAGATDQNVYPIGPMGGLQGMDLPEDDPFNWNIDNYGPIVLPRRGMTVELTPENMAIYWRVIGTYEGHDLQWTEGKVMIDGEVATSYTFGMDYYWMMGDNRHNSEDSRIWGFVPETHVVGRPLFVFFSYESDFGVRWNRIGTKYTH